MNIKDITIPFDNSLLFAFRTHTNLSTLNHNVRFLPCQHRGVGIMQYVYAKPCVHRFNYSGTPAEVPIRAVDIVNQNTMTINRT